MTKAWGTTEAWRWCFGVFLCSQESSWNKKKSCTFPYSRLVLSFCLFAVLSQYLKSFMSVFTEKTVINKRPPGLSLGKQVTQEPNRLFCLSEGQGLNGLISSSSGAHPRARLLADKALTCPEVPQSEVPYCSHKLAVHNYIFSCGSWKQCVQAANSTQKKRSISHRLSAAAHEVLIWNSPIIVKGPLRRTNKSCHVS